MSDLIERQKAIDGLEGYIDDKGIFNQDRWFVHGIKTAITHLKGMPPAQPERQKGKWIPVTRIEEWSKEEGLTGFPPEVAEFPTCTIRYVDATEPDEVDAVKCSECGTVFDFTDARNWCSECGADMRGDSNDR